MNKSKILAFTIIARNYYPQAEILAKSYKKYHPDHKFLVFFIDDDCITSPNYQAVPISKVDNISDFKELCFKYSLMELATAVKPFIFSWLFKKYDAQKVLYIDPDICFYKKIDKILEELDNHECVIIPHRTKPTNDKKRPNEWDFMGCGYYNLGFAAFRNSTSVSTFLKWWADKLKNYAYSDIDNFMFTDQKWMDFAPSFLNTYILRDKGYDTAYWNLHEYVKTISPNDIYFFHFSGFVPEKSILSKHQDRFTLDNIGPYNKLFQDYAKQITYYNNLHPEIKNYHYPYQCFDNGVEITSQIKDIYRHIISTGNDKFSSLFDTKSKNSFFACLSKIVLVPDNTKVLNYFLLLNESISEIHKEFPLEQPYNLQLLNSYINWSLSYGKSIYNTPENFINNQNKLHNGPLKTFFNKNIPIPTIQTIFALEADKRNKNNSDFVVNSYKIILHRNPDTNGYNKNLKDLNNYNASRNLLLIRLFKSQEFYYKHGKLLFNPILPYYLYLATLSLKFLYLDKYLSKTKIFRSLYKNNKPSKQFPLVSNLGCNISGYLDTESGVGESARGIIKALESSQIPINLNNIEQPWLRRDNKTLKNQFTNKSNHPINLICVNADQIKSVVENQLHTKYIKFKYNIGYWYWESDIFPDLYSPNFEPVNEIWTATSYVQKAISLKSPKPVICIPPSFTLPLTSTIPRFDFAKYKIKTSPQDFIFLNIFDSASFWQRKNPFALIKAFKQFSVNNKHTQLLIKTTKLATSEIFNKIKNEIGDNSQIHLIDSYISSKEMISLMKSCDCYISLHRAEGLGIPLINAHMMGKPVIVTNFSGNTDFETNSNTFLVNHVPYILTKDIGPYPAGTTWADPDVDHASFLMDKIYHLPTPELNTILKRSKEEVTAYFSPERIGNLIKQRLDIINKLF